MVREGRVFVGTKGVPYVKSFLADEREGSKPSTLIDSTFGTTKAGGIAIRELFGDGKVFDYPKPPSLIRRLIRVSGAGSADLSLPAIVMDFFAGSGSTGQAVLEQNVTDDLGLRYVLVQLPEPLDPDDKDQRAGAEYCDKLGRPRNIAELTKERLRRAGVKVRDENPMFAGDTGFRVFKLDSTNIQAWEPDHADLEQTLEGAVDHLKVDRSEQDILFELLLKLGLDLCVPIERRVISGKEVHSVGGGVLLVCLAPTIARQDVETLARGIVTWHAELAPAGDATCVFRDSAFADDVAKTNLAAILEQHGLKQVRSL